MTPTAPSLTALRRRYVDIRDATEVSERNLQRLPVGAVEVRAIDRSAEIGHEHAAALRIERQAEPFHQVVKHALRRTTLPCRPVERRAIHGVTPRRVTAIGPIPHPSTGVDVEVDRLRQP